MLIKYIEDKEFHRDIVQDENMNIVLRVVSVGKLGDCNTLFNAIRGENEVLATAAFDRVKELVKNEKISSDVYWRIMTDIDVKSEKIKSLAKMQYIKIGGEGEGQEKNIIKGENTK